MKGETMIAFLSGVVTLGYMIAGAWFLKFWKRTGDRLFVSFALAFWLFALNQIVSVMLGSGDREIQFEYILRVLGFVLILIGIARKNVTLFRGRN
jgi:hypothetical protein